ncbi:MAG TPA: NAD(P)-binding protein [Longimicrobiales bacterium]|nr:NAD(P)-binding protein [Longimicrobiales bacterium]
MSEQSVTNDSPPRISVSSTSTLANRTGSWKYIRPRYQDGVAPCNARCPTGVDVEGYMNLLREGRVADALDLVLRENPMPAITGRVCHHPCELACNRAQFDDPVAVHLVEREMGDRVLSMAPPVLRRTRAEKVAVVGSGPAGLACAYHLTRLGYGVTVFEEAAEAGGMLRQGIPDYRLPRDVLDRQIQWFSDAGIEFRCNTRIAGEYADKLLRDFAAVFVGTGAHRSRPLGVTGEDSPRVIAGLDFLKAVNRGEAPEIGQRVVVVGGGNTAIDCARTALRLGATPVVLYRRTRQEMPAIAAEVDEAIREGIAFEFLAAPRAVHHLQGRRVGVECERMVLAEPDESGRRRPVPANGGTFSVLAETVLTAIGEEAGLEALPLHAAGADQALIDELGATPAAGIWAGGDAAGIERTVSDALGSGKVAAIGIDRAIRTRNGESVPPNDIAELRWSGGNISMSRWRGNDPVHRHGAINDVVGFDRLNTAHFVHIARQREERDADHSAVETAGTAFERATDGAAFDFGEVNPGLTAMQALEEARRCLNCGVCNQCELCLILCPDVAITRQAGGTGFDIDLNYCKGCGVCAMECPRGAIVMTREGL